MFVGAVRLGSCVVSVDVESRSCLLGSVVEVEENEGWRGMCILSSFRVRALQTRISHAFRRLLIEALGLIPKWGCTTRLWVVSKNWLGPSIGQTEKWSHADDNQKLQIPYSTNGATLILQILREARPTSQGFRQFLFLCPCTRHSLTILTLTNHAIDELPWPPNCQIQISPLQYSYTQYQLFWLRPFLSIIYLIGVSSCNLFFLFNSPSTAVLSLPSLRRIEGATRHVG